MLRFPRQNADKRGDEMQGTDNATMLLGRVLLSLLFLIGGTIKLLGPAATQATLSSKVCQWWKRLGSWRS
jgi:hypothetical protein